MHCSITFIENNCTFLLSFAYGLNDIDQRRLLWKDLRLFESIRDLPWLLTGDFYTLFLLKKIQVGWEFGIEE